MHVSRTYLKVFDREWFKVKEDSVSTGVRVHSKRPSLYNCNQLDVHKFYFFIALHCSSFREQVGKVGQNRNSGQ